MPDQRRDTEHRPSPEALLEAARREERRLGKLRIFVGAAPGVGKTYEMLQQARARKKDGYDIVVGVVETHGRKETEVLLEGLEVIQRRQIEYKGQFLDEMDLDAIIARRPQIVLVDELAHTNAPGTRHPKRYLDVEELLSHGINVYSTVNIQHIESLNDVVAQITHVRVRETVPDSIFDRADAVELVDLTPDDLIQRLKEGKVYVPNQAERALEHFFSPANLTALRELALRRTAERVDEQLLTEMQARAIPGPWAAGERILVCISEDPRAAGLVRYSKRLADRLHGPLTALYVGSRRSLQLSEEQRDRIADTLRLAEALGGEAVTIPSADRSIADDMIGYAQENNVTQIIIGKSTRSRWFEILHGSVVHDLVRRSGNISVHVIAGDQIAGEPIPKKTTKTVDHVEPFNLRPYIFALAMVAAALAIERVRLVEDLERARRTAETDRLRSALLTSISHDLKTPLAAVLGALGTLRSMPEALSEAQKADLLATSIDESERLNRFIANLLDMTKLESGAVAPNIALHDLGEIVGSTLERASKILAQHRVEVDLAKDLPMVRVDPVLFEQVLFNLLDNAAKYAPAGTTVRIESRRDRDSVGLQVLDEGEGIPPEELEQVFDKFYRARKIDRVRAGTGLGLAISRGFVEAMEGTIWAANRTDRSGAVFTIKLPIPTRAEQLDTAA